MDINQVPKNYYFSVDRNNTLAPTKDLFLLEGEAPIKVTRAQLVALTLNEICAAYCSGMLRWVPSDVAEENGHIDMVYAGKEWDGDACTSYWSMTHSERLQFAKFERPTVEPKAIDLRVTLALEDQTAIRWPFPSNGDVLLWYGKSADQIEFTYLRDIGILEAYAPGCIPTSGSEQETPTWIEYVPELKWDAIPREEQNEYGGLHHVATRFRLHEALGKLQAMSDNARDKVLESIKGVDQPVQDPAERNARDKIMESANGVDQPVRETAERHAKLAGSSESHSNYEGNVANQDEATTEVNSRIAERAKEMTGPRETIPELHDPVAELETRSGRKEKFATLHKRPAVLEVTVAELEEEMTQHEISRRKG